MTNHRRRRTSPRWVAARVAAVATLVAVAGAAGRYSDGSPFRAPGSVPVEAFTEPIESIMVAAAQSGIVSEVHRRPGDIVEPGSLIVSLNTSVLAAEREIAAARATSTAKTSAAAAQLSRDESRLAKLRLLQRQGAGSTEELARADTDVQVSRANLTTAREDVLLNKLQIKHIDAQIEQRRIRSTIHGVVLTIEKEAGEHIAALEPNVAQIVNIDRLRVRFHVPTTASTQLSTGDRVTVAFPNSSIRKTTGEVEFVAPVTAADSDTVRVDVVLNNTQRHIRSGIRCRLLTDLSEQRAATKMHSRRKVVNQPRESTELLQR